MIPARRAGCFPWGFCLEISWEMDCRILNLKKRSRQGGKAAPSTRPWRWYSPLSARTSPLILKKQSPIALIFADICDAAAIRSEQALFNNEKLIFLRS